MTRSTGSKTSEGSSTTFAGPGSLDVVEVPYAFTQLPLLTASAFLKEARERGLHLSESALESLHRAGLLVPLYRVRRDWRRVVGYERRGDEHGARYLAHGTASTGAQVAGLLREDRLRDPSQERFRPWRHYRRDVAGHTSSASYFLYSWHQLHALHAMQRPLYQAVHRRERNGSILVVPRAVAELWHERARTARAVAIVAAVLEPVHYSQIIGRLRLTGREDFADYYSWRAGLQPGEPLQRFGIEPSWLRERAGYLLSTANAIDPLGPWSELVAHADPSTWAQLRGDARAALDRRITAELLMLHHESLVRAGLASAPPQPPPRSPTRFDHRLRRERPIDEVLTEFGLSPHPSLLLIVEGSTERMLFPRVMQFFEIRTEEDFLAIHDAEGVDRDLSALVGYMAVRVGGVEPDGYHRLIRPPTRLLAVMDPEGKMATPAGREHQRQLWIDRLLAALPSQLRTREMRDQLEPLVEITTWTPREENFEFAHFTDRQLAHAIARIDTRRRRPSVEVLVERVGYLRASRKNLDVLLPDAVSKVALADALWPVLRRKIARADKRGMAERVPIVRVLDRALALAHELPRRHVVIGTSRD